MLYRLALAGLILVVAGPSVRSDTPKADDDAKKLQGEWQAIEVEMNGKKGSKDDADVKNMRLVIKDDEMTFRPADGNGAERKKKFKLDASKSPKEIDVRSLDGQESGQTAACIYKLEKDRLTLCIPYFAKDPTARPREFKAGADDGVMLLVLERMPAK